MTQLVRNQPISRTTRSLCVGVVLGILSIVAGLTSQQAAPANAAAGDGITAYVSPPLVQGPPSAYGTSLETFASWNSCSSFPASAIGTFSGSCSSLTNGYDYVWGGASSTSDTPFVGGVPSQYVVAHGTQLTVTFASPAKYVGFWWSAGSANNIVKLYTAASGVTPVATFTTATIDSLLGASMPNPYPGSATVSAIDGTTYKKGHYFGRPSDHTSLNPTTFSAQNNQSHAYLNIFASGSIAFTKIEFTGMNFEFDNVAISSSAQSPTPNLVFIESVLGKTVTYLPNGGTGTMNAQTEPSASTLASNTFTRTGYTFTGWHTNSAGTGGTSYTDQASYNFASDLTLHAQWTLTPLAITFNTQGGSAIANGSSTMGASIATSPGTPTRDGYTFNGWYANSTGGTALTFPYAHARTANFTLYAQWTPNNLVVTNDTQGGGTIANGSTTTGASIASSPGTPTRDGYTFSGWFANATGGTAITFPYTHARTTNFTLYAQWAVIPTTTTTTATIAPSSITPSLEAPRIATVGQPIYIKAKGFAPGERVVLRIGGGKTTTLIANAQGEVRLEVVLDSAASGNKQVVTFAAASGRSVSREIRVNTPQTLPTTGSNSALLVMWGMCLSMMGIALLMRRRLLRR